MAEISHHIDNSFEIWSTNECRCWYSIILSKSFINCVIFTIRRNIPNLSISTSFQSSVTSIWAELQLHPFHLNRSLTRYYLFYEMIDFIGNFCQSNEVDDEFHYLFKCQHFNNIRKQLLPQINIRTCNVLFFKRILNETGEKN